MISPEELYAVLYKDLHPADYWDFEFQDSLARDAIAFFLNEVAATFGEDTELDFDIIQPYAFTLKGTYETAYTIAAQLRPVEGWCFSPDGNGGIVADYVGQDNICSVLLTEEDNAMLEVLVEKNLDLITTVYSWEVPTEMKIIDMKKMLDQHKKRL